jgi:imidazolonepropionase
MPLIVSLGCILLHMTPEECVTATTINPAASLHLDAEMGTLHAGKRADFVVLDLESYKQLGYAFGGNPVVMTVKGGVPVVTHLQDWDRGPWTPAPVDACGP